MTYKRLSIYLQNENYVGNIKFSMEAYTLVGQVLKTYKLRNKMGLTG